MAKQLSGNKLKLFELLLDRKSASNVVRCSAEKMGDELEWSKQYTLRILEALENLGFIEALDIGSGHRSNKWKLHPSSGTLKIPGDASPQVRSGTLFTVSSKRRAELSKRKATTYVTRGGIFENAPKTRKKTVTGNRNPFRRFQSVWDDPDVWGATDLVCYFSYLYERRWGEKPTLRWPLEAGSAKTLLQRVKKPLAAKIYLQVCFVRARFRPKGLRSFIFDDFYDEIIEFCQEDDEFDEEYIDDYSDEEVFPWLRKKMLEETRKMNEHYRQDLVRMANSPHYQERKRQESRQRFNKNLDRLIVQETYRG